MIFREENSSIFLLIIYSHSSHYLFLTLLAKTSIIILNRNDKTEYLCPFLTFKENHLSILSLSVVRIVWFSQMPFIRLRNMTSVSRFMRLFFQESILDYDTFFFTPTERVIFFSQLIWLIKLMRSIIKILNQSGISVIE